jgi:hypothetical protein
MTINSFLLSLQATALKELPKFTGDPDQKVTRLVNAVKYIGAFIALDDSALHALATIKLGGSVFIWYDNNNETLRTWSSLKIHLLERFQPSVSSANAQLKSRRQQADESLLSYYDDIIDLCKQADSSMPLYMIVDYLLDGVRDDLKIHIERRLQTFSDTMAPATF